MIREYMIKALKHRAVRVWLLGLSIFLFGVYMGNDLVQGIGIGESIAAMFID